MITQCAQAQAAAAWYCFGLPTAFAGAFHEANPAVQRIEPTRQADGRCGSARAARTAGGHGHGTQDAATQPAAAGVASAMLVAALAAALLLRWGPPGPRALTQDDIDRAVLHTLNTKSLPAPAAKAYEAVRGSVVKVIGWSDRKPPARRQGRQGRQEGRGREEGQGRQGGQARRAAAGRARRRGYRPRRARGARHRHRRRDHGQRHHPDQPARGLRRQTHQGDLRRRPGGRCRRDRACAPSTTWPCCARARSPTTCKPATMRSTHDLRPGDRVTAVGFPFGIGPSVSHGVVSGLKREFRSPEGQAHPDQPDPVRCRRQPRQFGRPAGHRRR